MLQCTTAYPCPPERVGLNLVTALRERYGCAVGLSDHSGTIFPTLAAAALGAEVFEVHVTLSREMFGPDVTASVTTSELAELVRGVRFIDGMLAHPVDKDLMAPGAGAAPADLRQEPGRPRAAPARDGARAPAPDGADAGTGFADQLDGVLGSRLRRDVAADAALAELIDREGLVPARCA